MPCRITERWLCEKGPTYWHPHSSWWLKLTGCQANITNVAVLSKRQDPPPRKSGTAQGSMRTSQDTARPKDRCGAVVVATHGAATHSTPASSTGCYEILMLSKLTAWTTTTTASDDKWSGMRWPASVHEVVAIQEARLWRM